MADLNIDPFYIDINLVSSLDIQQHMSDYVDLINAFPDEMVLNHMYWHTDSHSDPISSKIDFYKKLNSKEIEIAGNVTGENKSKTDRDSMENKNIRDQLLVNSHVVTDTGNKYGKPSTTSDSVSTNLKTYTKQWKPIEEGVTHENSNSNWDVINDEPESSESPVVVSEETDHTFEEKFGMVDMSAWFMMWWIEKFRTSHEQVKMDLKKLLGDDNEYFVDFSESVGQLKNLTDVYDASTTPIPDINVELFENDSIPTVIAGVARYCTKTETESLATQLSKKTNSIYRKNIFNICDDSSRDVVYNKLWHVSTESHGCNLVYDGEHPKRLTRFVGTVREQIQKHLKGLYGILDLLSNRENYMVAGKPKQIMLKVEDYTMSVDLLKNKIVSTEKTSDDVTIAKFGKPTHYNKRLSNDDYLRS